MPSVDSALCPMLSSLQISSYFIFTMRDDVVIFVISICHCRERLHTVLLTLVGDGLQVLTIL